MRSLWSVSPVHTVARDRRDRRGVEQLTAVVVVGSGFAGLWAALGAARRLDELAVPAGAVDITVLSAKPFHDIRVRNYEMDLSACRIPLADVLAPAGVAHVVAEVTAIDTCARTVTASGGVTYGYDRMVLASGSHVVKPAIPGLREFGFDVDTYDGAITLDHHLRGLADGPLSTTAATVVVVGAGLTGIEAACELPSRLRALFGGVKGFKSMGVTPRVVLVDRNAFVGSDMRWRTTVLKPGPGWASRPSPRMWCRCHRVNGWRRPPWCGARACGPAR